MLRGSDNLTQPLAQRVHARIEELRTVGYNHFQKGEDNEHHLIPAEMPIAGKIFFRENVKVIDKDHFELKYQLLKTEIKDGIVTPIRKLQDPATSKKDGTMVKTVNRSVVETFKKGKPFTRKVSVLETDGIAPMYKDKAFRAARRALTGADAPETEAEDGSGDEEEQKADDSEPKPPSTPSPGSAV